MKDSDTSEINKKEITHNPLVSVVLCVYNGGEFLRLAVKSVLEQTYSNFELLIIDDGSTDGCVESISDIVDGRIRILRQPNCGRSVALNYALTEVRGEYYMLQDADDISFPLRIERLLGCMLAHREIAGVFSGHRLIVNNKYMAPQFKGKSVERCRQDILRLAMPAHDPTAMYRMSMVQGIEYDASLPLTQGVDYTLRVGEQFPLMVLAECLYSYRIHQASLTKVDPKKRLKDVETCLIRACQRRGFDSNPIVKNYWAQQNHIGRHQKRDNNLAADFMESVCDLRQAGRSWQALLTGLRCSRLHPLDLHYQKALIYAVAPKRVVRFLRKSAQAI